jgi:hypothetical protein
MPKPILDPLWSLMLSTNDCYPGCCCDDDFFDMSPERISVWTDKNGIESAIEASQVLVALLDSQPLDYDALSKQTNVWLPDVGEAVQWLDEWKSLIDECIATHST